MKCYAGDNVHIKWFALGITQRRYLSLNGIFSTRCQSFSNGNFSKSRANNDSCHIEMEKGKNAPQQNVRPETDSSFECLILSDIPIQETQQSFIFFRPKVTFRLKVACLQCPKNMNATDRPTVREKASKVAVMWFEKILCEYTLNTPKKRCL